MRNLSFAELVDHKICIIGVGSLVDSTRVQSGGYWLGMNFDLIMA